MPSDDTMQTSPTLLRRSADWRNHSAWGELVARYDPLIQGWCREYRLDDDFAEEVAQLFWIELAEKMRSFCYDPSRRFRGWLRRCFHWRVVDAIRERRRAESLGRSIDDPSVADLGHFPVDSLPPDEEDDESTPRRLLLLELAERVQADVRDRVHPQSWQVFWHIAIDGWSTRETAEALNMTYLAAYAAHRRVGERLAAEGNRRLAEWIHSKADLGRSRP